MNQVPYSKQSLSASDIEAVQEVLTSDFITQGPKIGEFERAFASYCGAKYAVAVSSGTAALHLAVQAAGLNKGEEAITTPITFLATANAILYVGARPVFADIDCETANIDPASVERCITKKTKVIIPVDFAGLPCQMRAIHNIAMQHGLTVIEDASHALGGEYDRDRYKVGSCTFSDLTIFSFHPVKHITTGEGGCITTNNKTYYEKLKALRSHGVYKEGACMKRFGPWYYEMKELGFNYRITDFQCALGMKQLERLDQFLTQRTQIAHQYNEAFADFGAYLRIPAQRIKNEKHAWHLYLLRLKLRRPAKVRRSLFEHLKANGINVQVHYIPIYWQPYYRNLFNSKKVYCPNTERYYSEVLSLPLFPELGRETLYRIIGLVKDFLTKKVSLK